MRTAFSLMVMPRSRSRSMRVEELLLHLALLQRAGGLDQPVGQRGFAVVDVRDDAEVANAGLGHGEQYNGGVAAVSPLCLCPMPTAATAPGPAADHRRAAYSPAADRGGHLGAQLHDLEVVVSGVPATPRSPRSASRWRRSSCSRCCTIARAPSALRAAAWAASRCSG